MSNMHRLLPVMRTIMIGALCWSVSSAFALGVGVVDMETIMQSSKLRALATQLQSKLETHQEELEGLKKDFESLKTEFEKNEMLMDDATRQSKQSQLQKKAEAFETARKKLSAIVMNEQKQFQTKFQDIVAKFAQSEKIDVLLGGPNGVLYADPKLDKTQDIANLIKKAI